MNSISDVATNPSLQWVQKTGPKGGDFTAAGDPSRFEVRGESAGVNIKVILEPMGEGIITGYPEEGADE